MLWSVYACYTIFRYDYDKEAPSNALEEKEERTSLKANPDSQSEANALFSNRITQKNVRKETIVGLKKEPTISKTVKRQSNT